jgi:hypothetical protein
MQIIRLDSIVDRRPGERPDARGEKNLVLRLDGFAHRAINEESIKLGVPVEELASFAVLYYLADLDSGRIARRFPPSEGEEAGRAEEVSRRRG